jgi:hypothetical protein
MEHNETVVTKNLLRFCYTCDHAHACETEETSKECWNDKGFAMDESAQEDTTAELFRLYAQ